MAHLVRGGSLEALQNDRFVDFTIKCNEKAWKVHKTHFAGESTAIAAHMSNSMMEGVQKEIRLDDYFPQAVEGLIFYQHSGSYDEVKICKRYIVELNEEERRAQELDTPASTAIIEYCEQWTVTPILMASSSDFRGLTRAQAKDVFMVNIELYRLGDIYDLPNLQQMAARKILQAECYFVSCEFDEILAYLWDNTTDDDTDLRLAVYDRCTLNYDIIETSTKIEAKLIDLVGYAAWTATKARLRSAATYQVQMQARIQAQADTQAVTQAKIAKSKASNLKRNLGRVHKALTSAKTANNELQTQVDNLETENWRLKEDLADIMHSWEQIASAYCANCRRPHCVESHWTGRRDTAGCLVARCACRVEWVSGRPQQQP